MLSRKIPYPIQRRLAIIFSLGAAFCSPGMIATSLWPRAWTARATLYLLEKGVKVVGIDAWGWDRPLPFIAKEFQETGDPRVMWEAHFAGIEIGYCHTEKMANLSEIVRFPGFTVACFLAKIKGASAGWVRPVAIMEED